MTLQVQTFDPRTGAAVLQPLAMEGASCELRLRAVPGASAIHLPLLEDGRVVFRAEVGYDTGGIARVTIAVGPEGGPVVSAPQRVLVLPPAESYAPPLPFRPFSKSHPLDVCVLVDGTLRRFVPPPPGQAVPTQAWRDHVSQFGAFLDALTEGHADARVAVLAFGDARAEAARAHDLRPAYLLYPERQPDRQLKARTREDVCATMERLPPTSGGDFVDALGYALRECQSLAWRDQARRLLLLIGDSPGFSLLFPPPPGSDARIRRFEVEAEAMRLHRARVEIATIYHETPMEPGSGGAPAQLVDYARAQYARLASRPELVWQAASFDPARAAEAARTVVACLGRGPALGQIVKGA